MRLCHEHFLSDFLLLTLIQMTSLVSPSSLCMGIHSDLASTHDDSIFSSLIGIPYDSRIDPVMERKVEVLC